MAALADALDSSAQVEVLTSAVARAQRRPDSARYPIRRAPVLRDKSGAIRGYVQYLSFDVPLFFRLLLLRHDVIVAEAPPTTGFVCLIVARIRRSRFVYYPGDVWTDAVISMGASPFVVSMMRWIEGRVVRGADRILAVSAEVADRLQALGAPAAQIATVGNGVDTGVFRPDVQPAATPRPYFVYTGTMSEWQGPDVFIRALAQLEDAEIELRFFGQGVAEDELRALADALAPGRVHFGGLVSPDASAEWIRGALGALVSIVPGIGYDFAKPTKTYAAAACGTPVLFAGPAIGGDLVVEHGLGLAVEHDPERVAGAMRLLREQAANGDTERFRDARAAWAASEVSLGGVGARAARVIHNAMRAGVGGAAS